MKEGGFQTYLLTRGYTCTYIQQSNCTLRLHCITPEAFKYFCLLYAIPEVSVETIPLWDAVPVDGSNQQPEVSWRMLHNLEPPATPRTRVPCRTLLHLNETRKMVFLKIIACFMQYQCYLLCHCQSACFHVLDIPHSPRGPTARLHFIHCELCTMLECVCVS